VRLVTQLYGSAGPVLFPGMSLQTTDPVALTIDDEVAVAAIGRIRWRVASSGPWLAQNTFLPPFGSVFIERPALTDIEIEVTWRPGALRLREAVRSRGRTRGSRPALRGPALREHRRRSETEAGSTRTTLYTLPGTQS
jgi:hypothetical protein